MTIIWLSIRHGTQRFIHVSLFRMSDVALISVKNIFSHMLKMKISQRRTLGQKAVAMVTHTTGCSGPTPAVLTGYQSMSWLRGKKKQQCESGVRDFFPSTSISIMHKSEVQGFHGDKSFLKKPSTSTTKYRTDWREATWPALVCVCISSALYYKKHAHAGVVVLLRMPIFCPFLSFLGGKNVAWTFPSILFGWACSWQDWNLMWTLLL